MIERLAALADRRAKRVVIVAAVFFVVAGALGAGVADRLDPYSADDPATESVIAEHDLQHAGYRESGVIVLVDHIDPSSAAGGDRIRGLSRQLRDDRAVASVARFRPDDPGSKAFVSRDGDATYLAVALKPTADDARQRAAERIAASLEGERGVTVGGGALAQKQMNAQTESDLRRAELLAFPFLFLLSLLFFRSLVAALLPLIVGGLAIVGTMLVLRGASEVTPVSIFALNLVTGLGLGLAIDYSLFIVSRYREEIARTGPGLQAMRRTMATAGRTVLFSSLTVAGALASLMVFPQNFLHSMGIGGSLVALIAAAIALLVLPAVLSLLGERVNSLAPAFLHRRADRDARPAGDGFWYRLTQLVMRFPVRIALATSVLLIALGIPFLSINFTSVDASVLPESASARQVDDTLRAEFPPYHDTPIVVALEDAGRARAQRTADGLADVAGVAAVNPPQRLDGSTWAIEVISKHSALSGPSQDLVERIRDRSAAVSVTGFTAHYVDLQSSLVDHLPMVLAVVVVVTFAVLFLMTGSVILPLKQVLMNALGLSATFGILVLIFQDGRFQDLLGYQSQGGLESTQPLLLFAVAFGLSTDYGVFLLARIKEARDGGYDDRESVAVGLERTGRIVTAAALLFSIAIGAFVTSQVIFIKEVGLGTAIAVLIDATIIRALLVPSLMLLLGKWNWWAPSPLRRLHERIGLRQA
ncbi:MAG: putative drug exporter of the superfamily [Solirubrobacterales bacterium]|jgi:RND superfamily putative drug exporter|nr:putative drug exporter of the superfamily [Solirubrobacterales bacterium]